MTTIIAPTSTITKVAPLGNGQVLTAGYLVTWNDVDRQGDRFDPSSFDRAASQFLNDDPLGQRLLFHHRPDLGRVGTVNTLDVGDHGLYMTATLDYQDEGSHLRPVWAGVLSGKVSAYSVGGFFSRREYGDGTKAIHNLTMTEASVTAKPVGYRTGLRVVATGADPMGDAAGRAWLEATRRQLGL